MPLQYSHRNLFLILFVSLIMVVTMAGCGGVAASPTAVAPDAAHIVVSPSSLDFGSVPVGTQKTNSVTVSNSRGNTAHITQITATGAGFSVVSPPSLPLGLAAGESATITVGFKATSAGAAGGSLSILFNGTTPSISYPLSGTGVVAGQLGVSPATMAFGNVLVGSSQKLTGSLTASGAAVTVSSASLAGAGYSLSGIVFPVTISAGQSVPFTVTFVPQTAVSSTGSIAFASNASNSPATETLSGSGIAAGQLGVSPATMAFGNVLVGSSQKLTGSLTASGAAVTVSSANLAGAGYSLSGIVFPVTISAGQSVPFTVTFVPQTAVSSTGSIAFASNASNSPATETLSGSGIAAGQLSVSPATMAFGGVAVGSSQKQTGSLTAGTSGITVSSASWNGAGYSLSGIVFPVTVAAGQSIPFTMTFAPQTAGSSAGSVAFFSNASNSPVTESLSGNGLVHSVDISWTASTSVVAGYNIYRATQSGGPYTRVNSSLQPGTTFSDNNVQSGATYYYVVTAADGSSLESLFSGEVVAVIPVP